MASSIRPPPPITPRIARGVLGGVILKLVACPKCHAQYDVADCPAAAVACPCGTSIPTAAPVAKDLAVTRCAACGALVAETAVGGGGFGGTAKRGEHRLERGDGCVDADRSRPPLV